MPPSSSRAELARRTVTITGIVMAMTVLLLAVYVASPAVFILFASLILAAVFDGAARGLTLLGVPRRAGLLLVFLLTLALIAALFLLGGAQLAAEAGSLVEALRTQAEAVLERLSGYGLPVGPEEIDPAAVRDMMPDTGGMVSSASTALFSVVGAVGNLFIILFLAAFVVWQPRVYRQGLVSLFPRAKRARIGETVDASAHALRMWLLGEGISMLTVFAVCWAGLWLIGMPYAFLLALQAGLLAFVPTLGAFVAGIPIVLTGLSVDGTMALLGLLVYLVIQGVESNVTTPLAQRWAASLPPALTLGAQLVFGYLFGLAGIVLAVPLVAVAMVVVRMLYVEDVLGGPAPPDRAG